MRIQDYLGKITWTAVDKLLFILYGFVTIVQIKVTNDTAAYGLFTMLTALQTWIFIVSDGSALQGIIQFGMDKGNRPKVNTISGVLHISVVMGFSVLIALLHSVLATIFNEPRIAQVALWLPVYCLLTIPRSFCLKLLLRDLQMKQIFWVNFSWFGTMSGLTFWLIANGSLSNPLTSSIDKFHLLSLIAFTGMLVSSVTAVVLSRGLLGFGMRGEITFKDIITFGLPQAGVSTTHNIVRQLDGFLLLYFFHDAGAVGVYNAAKTLYRVFEQGVDAVGGLIYPLAIRLIGEKKYDRLTTTISKSISFLLIPSIFIVMILEAGATDILVSLLGAKFKNSSHAFNVLIIASLFLPVTILSSVIMAFNAVKTLLQQVCIAAIIGVSTYICVGSLGRIEYYALGTVMYIVSLAVQQFIYVSRKTGLTFPMIFRAIPDAYNYFRIRI
ncbi:MAG: hypothetical protein U0Y96_15110 [Candidatus Kapaibacterium sp.]|nr:hypothetical protein [Bacteroidota bacterium]